MNEAALHPPLADVFSAETALAYARALARPRKAGTAAQAAVAQEITARLEAFGWRVERQPFQFSTLVNAAIALEIAGGLLLIAAGLWARATLPGASAVSAALLLALILLSERLNRVVQDRGVTLGGDGAPDADSGRRSGIFPKTSTANLIAEFGGAPHDSSRPRLLLAAHYDSKSQRAPIAVRLALFALTLGAAFLYAALTLSGLIAPPLSTLGAVFGVIALAGGAPLALLALDSGNASPGAIDNASGVGTVLHLAECLTARPDLHHRLHVTLLITSAEEAALMGAAAYVKANIAELRRQAESGGLFVLNLDGVGVDGALFFSEAQVRRPGRLLTLIRDARRKLGLPVKRFGLGGVLFDHIPFARRGLEAVTLLAVGRASLAVHTPNDSADRLHVWGFEQAGRVAMSVIEKIGYTGAQGT
jgi:hypothetical protein